MTGRIIQRGDPKAAILPTSECYFWTEATNDPVNSSSCYAVHCVFLYYDTMRCCSSVKMLSCGQLKN